MFRSLAFTALAALAITVALALGGPSVATAATTYNVNTTADTNNAGGCTTLSTCSLREAVAAVNAGTGDDTISIPPGHYVLTAGELQVNQTVTVAGAGARTTTIDAGGNSRIFDFSGASTASISGLTLTGGSAGGSSPTPTGDGGAVVSQGGLTLNIDHVAMTGNTAVFGGGALNMPFETGSPGARGTVNITNSTFSGNTVTGGAANGQGGAMAIFGNLNITNSTISGNSVNNPGSNEGGGITAAKAATDPGATPPQVTFLNTTIAGNSINGLPPAGVAPNIGGGYSGDDLGGAAVLSETIAQNTIIAGNTVDGTPQDCNAVHTTTSDHNLSSDATCGFTDSGSRQNADPKLGALGDNGGDTATQALLAGSPAIDAGDDSGCPSSDQRGTSRPQADHCDIGAFELVFKTDLGITKVAAPATVTAGGNITYTITVANGGPQPAAGVTVTDPLSQGLGLVSTSLGSACAGTPLVCHLPDLASGASTSFTIVARAPTPGSVTNTATVSGRYGDPNPANDSATAKTTVISARRLADLKITDKSKQRHARVGDRVTYLLVVRNAGPDTATGVKVIDHPYSGLRIVGAPRSCSRKRMLHCKIRSLAKGKTLTLRVVALVTHRGRLKNAASVSAVETDPSKKNNKARARISAKIR
jgi:uncharacterized repeat protein (TIGR01451 family)/CSLREA domain-containing protein